MKLSVIIPAFNAEDTLAVQLSALSRQSWSSTWEVIVADNGSTDDTRCVAREFEKALPGLRIIDASDKRGAGHARNMAAKEAIGDALVFCDADDEVAPGWLEAMGQALSQHDFVACRLDAEKLSEAGALLSRVCPQQGGIQEYKYPPYFPHAGGGTLGVKRSLHEAVGGFDESFMVLEDTDYCWRIQLRGEKLVFVPDALINTRFRGERADIYRQARQWADYNVKIYKKYRAFGMPKLSWKTGVRTWRTLLRRLPREWYGEKRVRWLWDFNWAVGRLIACIKYRVLAL